MNKVVKHIIALAMSAFLLLAGGGIFYYCVIFLPNLEKIKNQQAQAMAENTRQQEVLQRKKCVDDADAHYQEMWKANCVQYPGSGNSCGVLHETTVSLKEDLYKEKQLCESQSSQPANISYVAP